MILFYKQPERHFMAEKLLLHASLEEEVCFAGKISGQEKVVLVDGMEAALEVNFSNPVARVVLISDDINSLTPDQILEMAHAGVSKFANRDDPSGIVEKVISAFREKKNLNFYIRQEQAEVLEVEDHKMQLEGMVNNHMVGQSPAIAQVLHEIKLISQYSGKAAPNILVRGEQGSGKEVVINTLRDNLIKAKSGFNVMTMGGVNPQLLASTLFGHVKGAFTGAIENKEGMLAASNGKVLYIDEITELSFEYQAMLLRALEYREYTEVGSNKVKYFDAQLLMATNRPLEKLVQAGEFREDLYNRLKDMMIVMPPLRIRKEDIPLLAQHFVAMLNANFPTMAKEISPNGIKLLSEMDWQGNVRELKNFITRAHVIESTPLISIDTIAMIIQKEEAPELEKAKSNMEMLREVAGKFNIDLEKSMHPQRMAIPENSTVQQQLSL